MRLKIFRATDMAAAMAQVRKELGAEALILNSRRVSGGVEVTAALEPEAEAAPAETPAVETVVPTSSRVAKLSWHGVPPEMRPALARGDLEKAIALALPFGVLPLDADERPMMFVGPPGAGKTLTVTRLATRLVMRGVSPLIITTDASRAGATEQLAAFARLLDLPLIVASNPITLARALARRRNGTPVLIDTAGAVPYEPAQEEELRSLGAAADAQLAVVLPAGVDPCESADLAVGYAACGGLYLIITRLDVTRRLGGIFAAAASSGLPLTEAGIGPGAADGLIAFTPALLAARLNGSGGTDDAI